MSVRVRDLLSLSWAAEAC